MLKIIIPLCVLIYTGTNAVKGPLSSDFETWLHANGLEMWISKFKRVDRGDYGSYGGREAANSPVTKVPVVFIHGNSDQALNAGVGSSLQTGWTNTIEYLMSKGYTSSELYATTWGPADITEAVNQVHSCDYVMMLRTFVEAVLKYTKSAQISMISHSMGVTLARKVVQGGFHEDTNGETCNLGPPLTKNVDTFIGIAGGNRGLAACAAGSVEGAACNSVNGFYPGICVDVMGMCKGNTDGLSEYLEGLNSGTEHYEGGRVYSIWSHLDDVIGGGDLVWGYPTSQIRGQDGANVYWTYGHMACKDDSTTEQYEMLSHNYN